MSSFKQLNKADVTTVPYAANKRWSFYYTSSPSNGVTFYRGTKSTFSPTSDNPATNNGQYRSLTYDLINHMYYQTYSGSLDTGSLMFNINTYESASQQRPTSSYFIYNDSPQLIKNFPLTGSISVISVSPRIFGSKILPHSFAMSASTVLIVDDGYGNLFDIDQATDDYVALSYVSSAYFADPTPDQGAVFVGNIFYAQGLVVITNQDTNYLDLLDPASTPPVQISFQNEHIIYENEVRCIVRESDFNLSYNPSLLKYGAQLTTASVDLSISSVSYYSSPGGIKGIRTDFTISSFYPTDVIINYTVNYTQFSLPYSLSFSTILPAGQTFLSVFEPAAGANTFTFTGTVINSTTYKQYELLDSTIKDFATASFFQPYTTAIGLYNDNNDLLMVAKLAKPIALSSDTDMTFIVRYDT